MMNRHQRRKANSGAPRVSAIAEVYELIGKGGKRIRLNISPMRHWAEQNAERVSIPIDYSYIERLLKRGAIAEDRVQAILASHSPKPLLLCRDINEQGDEIVDGNHTYVALGIWWREALREGLVSAQHQARANAYEIQPLDWRRFVIPSSQRRP